MGSLSGKIHSYGILPEIMKPVHDLRRFVGKEAVPGVASFRPVNGRLGKSGETLETFYDGRRLHETAARKGRSMKLVPLKQAEAKLMNAAAQKKLRSLSLATFKKDRSLTLERSEAGFENATAPLPPGAAGKRLLKDAFKREFPRSNKLYLAETTD